ncbi:keratin, type I cytoskeletal 20-like [Xyrauchen texanus]|uniref:keratin, type I cytoskeletal 20-like n=1 Tax=Xyrauchen texanus TaxID=154827 RepID=UPI002241E0B6|nr:keratin, type I cytoskeletal 20-like [Xyrauchen texanus]XP_051978032.1 keratin, type I cytoskeletal 20-like [Xyrauchen texanus]
MEELEEPKWALRDLNERLKGFLEHVKQLDQVNCKLEEQILEWGRRNAITAPRDWSDKEALAQELRDQVTKMLMQNTETLLQCDAVKLKASSLQTRCETEENLCLLQEQQVSQLKMKKEEVELTNTFLQKQLSQTRLQLQQILEEQERELDQHQQKAVEDCDRVLAQVAAGEDGRGMDLSWTSTQCDYSSPAQSSTDSATPTNPVPGPVQQTRPRKDATSPTAVFLPQVRAGDKVLKEARAELTEARKQWHRLQVEIESLHALEKSLQSSLRHTQLQYSVQLKDLSRSMRSLESELETVRDGLGVQRQNHSQLLNTKMRLEREIATYRKLLEHEEGRFLISDGQSLKLKEWKGSVPDPEQNGLANESDEEITQATSTERTPNRSPVLHRQRSLVILTEPIGSKDGEICTVKTQEILEGNVVRESAEGHGSVETEKIDKVIRQWEGSFFQGNPKLRKKSVSLRFNLHMAVADEGCGQIKQDSLPNVEVRLVMKRSRSIPTFAQ